VIPQRKFGNSIALAEEHRIRQEYDRVDLGPGDRSEGGVELIRAARREDLQLHLM